MPPLCYLFFRSGVAVRVSLLTPCYATARGQANHKYKQDLYCYKKTQ